MRKFKTVLLLAVCFIMLCNQTVLAKEIEYAPYKGYDYNSYDESKAAPVGYIPNEKVTGKELKTENKIGKISYLTYEAGNAESPSFLMIENNRIIETDCLFNIINIYDGFRYSNGEFADFTEATGVSINHDLGYLYISDRKSNSLLIANQTGLVISVITADAAGGDFSPVKTVIDSVGDVFVLSESRPNGYYKFSSDGSSSEFFAVENAGFTDIYYNASADKVFALSANGNVYDVGDDVMIINSQPSNNYDSFAFDAENEYFFMSNGDTIIKMDYSGVAEMSDVTDKGIAGIAFCENTNQLAVLTQAEATDILTFNSELKKLYSVTDFGFSFNHPTDIFYDNDKSVYILDSHNARILKLDSGLTVVKEIYAGFTSQTGEVLDITGAQGIYVFEDKYYISDTEHERVLVCDKYGQALNIITKPEQLSDTVKEPFRASKLIVDRNKELYVLADSVNMGAFVFSEDYTYKSFYGSNTVVATSDVLLNFFRKKFLTKKQLAATQNYTPITIRNIDMDSEGFLYTVTEKTSSSNIIRKLNYSGKNIIDVNNTELSFGDLEWDRQDLGSKVTTLIDIDIDKYGFINVVDEARNKIFQYSPEGHLLAVFGGEGEQIGLFKAPKAIESVGDKIYVLDESDCSITKFSATPYTVTFRNAYNSSSADADNSILNWQRVLDLNTNNQYPYYKIGLAYEVKGEYDTAMTYFKLADNRAEYSKAFREYRKMFVSDNIVWIVLAIVLIISILTFIAVTIKRKMLVKQGETYSQLETKHGLPVYTLFHPIDGFEQLRGRNLQSVKMASLFVVLWLVLKISEYFLTGFIFNNNRAIDYDLLATMVRTIGIFILFVVSNLAFTTFLGGKGRFKEIITVTAYSLIPVLISVFVNILLSNILTTQEAAFMGIVMAIGCIWSGAILILGLSTIHEYSFSKTILSIALSVIGMAVIALLILLFFTLMQQLFQFIGSVVYELKIR